MELTADAVRTAHADAWAEHGRLRLGDRGAGRLPGIRLMASGIPHPQWNNGDVHDPSAVDIEMVRAWYAERGVPWGVRVPSGSTWLHGRRLFTKRLMALWSDELVPAGMPDGCRIRTATTADVDDVVAIDAAAFEADPQQQRPWVAPLLQHQPVIAAVAEIDGRPVAVGHALRTDEDAGPALYVGGIGVLPHARGRGIGAAISSWLVEHGAAGARRLAHLHPDDERAARIYRRLGFAEVTSLDVYIDN